VISLCPTFVHPSSIRPLQTYCFPRFIEWCDESMEKHASTPLLTPLPLRLFTIPHSTTVVSALSALSLCQLLVLPMANSSFKDEPGVLDRIRE
jgi:hypothetical protein